MSDQRPNILWFCTDQQRFDTIGALHNPVVQTPHLDAFLRTAVACDQAYSQSPVCTPSRASFLTGRYPRTCRGRQNGQAWFPADELLVTRYLADHGWDGGLAGKLHLSACCRINEKDHRPPDGYRNFWWSHHPAPDWPESDYGQWLRQRGVDWATAYRPQGAAYAGLPTEHHQTTWCVDRAIEHLEQDHDGRPWLISVNVFDPHHAFDPPQEYLDRYDPATVPLPRWLADEWDRKTPYQQLDHRGAYGGQGMSVTRLSERELRQVVAAYYAMVSLIDDQFGRLLDHLEATGQRDNTIVIFMSDHGELLGDHGLLLKGGHFYDCAVRVPLLLSWPGRWQQGVVSDALVELTDLAPTLTEACGLPLPGTFQGRTLGPLLRGETTTHRADVYAEYHHAMPLKNRDLPPCYGSMLRTATHKIVAYHGVDAGELYDLTADPGEFHNLWSDPACRDLRETLLRRLLDRVVFTLDPWPPRIAPF
ncbi:MAG: sulfatase-like hydrolase/transferase [Fimbriimonadaceae bacterium]|nr:sulfatase-like hydrolase/transferase [Fimbriimonadaceae bacterium]